MRRIGAAVIGALTFLLAGCSAGLPQISVASTRAIVDVGPAMWCTADSQGAAHCQVDSGQAAAGTLPIAPGETVWVQVPADIARQPWLVVFAYRDTDGTLVENRTRIYDPGTRWLTTITPAQTGQQIVRVEVQTGLRPVSTATGTGVDFAALQTWIVLGR